MTLRGRLEKLEARVAAGRQEAGPARDPSLVLDAVAFAESLGFRPDDWQREVLRSQAQRILLNCSRQSGKSTTAAILALHMALYRPDSLALLLAPSLRQSGELARGVRFWLGRVRPRPALAEDNAFSLQIAGGGRIVVLPDSEGTIRGFSGVDLIIADEASRISDDLFRAVSPMLAVSGGRLILASTPAGQRGVFFQLWENGGPAWRRWEIPAGQVKRITAEFLAQERRDLGQLVFEQEYMCRFLSVAGGLFDLDLVRGAIRSDVPALVPTWKLEGGSSNA